MGDIAKRLREAFPGEQKKVPDDDNIFLLAADHIDSLQSQLDEANRIIAGLRGGKIRKFPDLEEKDILTRRITKLESELKTMRTQHLKVIECLSAIVSCWDGPLYKHKMLPLITEARRALRQQAKEVGNEHV